MAQGYELRIHAISRDADVFVLVSKTAHKDFIDDWAKDYKKQERLTRLTKVLQALHKKGLQNMLKTEKIRLIDASVDLYEIKNFFSTWRVMAFIKNETVLLLPFDAHKGGSNNIDSAKLKQAKELSTVANNLVKQLLETSNA